MRRLLSARIRPGNLIQQIHVTLSATREETNVADKKNPSLPPSKTGRPVVRTGPTSGQNRSRNNDGRWRAKRNDPGKSRDRKPGCFLTTAACEYKGLPDDCRELQVLRGFRDTYLLASIEGQELVERYYAIAPEIAACLTPDQAEKVWRVVRGCVKLVDVGDFGGAVSLYQAMVQEVGRETSMASSEQKQLPEC